VTKQQLDLAGSSKARSKVDAKAVQKLVDGEVDFLEALGASPSTPDDLRRQAIALYGGGKYEACIDVVLGLSALESVHPVDPLLLARCYTKLGDVMNAEISTQHYERMMRALGREVGGAS
jgi:hypothetical protein